MNLSEYYSNAKEKNNIPIVFVSDSNYLPYLSATIASIIKNSNINYTYHIILFSTDTPDTEIINFLKLQCSETKNFTFTIVSIIDFMNENSTKFNQSLDKGYHFTPAIYGRIIIPEILPFFEKVIYSDIDIIYQRDIAELISIDIGNKMIAAAPDIIIELNRLNEKEKPKNFLQNVHLNNDRAYINSGLILFNIKKCIESNFIKNTLSFIQKNNLNLPDQDAINSICKGDIHYLPQYWNCVTESEKIQNISKKIAENNKAKNIIDEWLKISQENNTCFHYTGAEKPWDSIKVYKASLFWYYFKFSPLFATYLTHMVSNQTMMASNYSRKIKKVCCSTFGIPIGYFSISENKRVFYLAKVPIYKSILYKNKEKIYLFGIRVFTKKYMYH